MTAIVAGSRVTVHDPRGDWQGYVRQMPDGPYEKGDPLPPAVVAVHHPQASGLAVYSVHRVPCRFLGAPYQATASTKTSRTEPATARGPGGR